MLAGRRLGLRELVSRRIEQLSRGQGRGKQLSRSFITHRLKTDAPSCWVPDVRPVLVSAVVLVGVPGTDAPPITDPGPGDGGAVGGAVGGRAAARGDDGGTPPAINEPTTGPPAAATPNATAAASGISGGASPRRGNSSPRRARIFSLCNPHGNEESCQTDRLAARHSLGGGIKFGLGGLQPTGRPRRRRGSGAASPRAATS